MTHPLLNQFQKLAGIPLAEGSEPTYSSTAKRYFAGMDMQALQVQKALTTRVLENMGKYGSGRAQAQEKLDTINEAIENLKAANAALSEGKLPDFLKKDKDDKDAKKDDEKEEKKEKSEKKEDDKDSKKDDAKEEKKEKSEKKEDDKDAKKDDEKEEKKEKSEKKEDDKDSKKDDEKEEKKEKSEKKEDDKDAKKDDEKEEKELKENADLLSTESLKDIVSRIIQNKGFQDKVATASKDDSSKATHIDTSDTKPEEMNDGKGLETHNETGFKPLGIPAEDNAKGGLMVPNAINVGDKANCFKVVKEGEEVSGKVSTQKFKMPKEVKSAVEQRIRELHEAIAEQDDKGYNDNGGVKQNAVDALNQFLQNGSKEDVTGIKESQVFLGTLMSPITSLLPKQLVDWLAISLNDKVE